MANYHQSVEEILKCAGVEQKLIWNQIFLQLGDNASVRQYCFNGSSIGSELLNYGDNKFYFAYQLDLNLQSGSPQLTGVQSYFHGIGDITTFVFNNTIPFWDATAAAARFHPNQFSLYNVWFSRIEVSVPLYIYFRGFKIGS